MKKALIILLLAVFYTNPALAQSDTFKKEVGFSTQLLFQTLFSSGEAPVELMYKQQLNSSNWFRFGLRTFISLSDRDRDELMTYQQNDYNTMLIQPMLGLEKRVNLNERWMIPFGLDALISYHKTSQYQRQPNHNPNNETYSSDRTDHSYGGSLRPFVGISYSPIPRLYFSTEASASLGYTLNRSNGEYFTNNVSQSTWTEKGSNVSLSLRPAAAIFIYYRF